MLILIRKNVLNVVSYITYIYVLGRIKSSRCNFKKQQENKFSFHKYYAVFLC